VSVIDAASGDYSVVVVWNDLIYCMLLKNEKFCRGVNRRENIFIQVNDFHILRPFLSTQCYKDCYVVYVP